MTKEIKNGHLFFDGCDTVKLAEKYGTPLYLYSETDMKNRIDELKNSFSKKYINTRIAYAGKAFLTNAMINFVYENELCLDVVSGGELSMALKMNFPSENIEFNGNNKLPWEIDLAVKNSVGRIIIDGSEELDLIVESAKKHNKKVSVLYRVTPDVAASTHDYIVTGKKDSKFGFPLNDEILINELEKAIQIKEIDVLGFHFHLGSQLFENEVYLKSLDKLFDFFLKINKKLGFKLKELNIGGGFGINYIETDQRKSFEFFFEPIMKKIEEFFKNHNLERPTIVTEPGRSIVGEAGITLYKIGSIKDIEGIRKYVSIDGGMTDNIRPALYQAKYEGVVANKANELANDKVTICGKCCESGDVIATDIYLAYPERDDILAIFSTGAYGHSMSSNYNKLPIPAVIFLNNGIDKLVVKRQSFEDMFLNDINIKIKR